MTDRALLTDALLASGMSARQFARFLLARNERTMRRWEAGDAPVPKVVSEYCARFVALSASDRLRVVRLLGA